MEQSRDGVTHIIDVAPRASDRAGTWLAYAPSWSIALVWFMRTMSCVWVVKGLINWSIVLGVNARLGDFAMLPRALQGSIVFFATVDLLAAVGLWLAAAWGGVLWILCAFIEAISPLLGTRGSLVGVVGVVLNIALVAAYFVLSWRASRERP